METSDPVTLFDRFVMAALPTATPVTTPLVLTVATAVVAEVHPMLLPVRTTLPALL